MTAPLIDITALSGIESLFADSVRDPWARSLAGEFADLFVYGDQIRYPLPIPSFCYGGIDEPPLVTQLLTRDPGVLQAIEYSSAEARPLADEFFSELVQSFHAWAVNNKRYLRCWLDLQKRNERMGGHRPVFSIESSQSATVETLSHRLDMDRFEVLYALDTIARYPLYGEIAGAEFYLNHRIRNAIKVPTMTTETVLVQRPAIAFRDAVSQMMPSLTFDSYTALLHELRGEVRSRNLHVLSPGEFDPDIAREIASKVGLPPKLRHVGRVVGIASGVVTLAGGIAILALPAIAAGAALSVSSALWSGRLPTIAGRMKWLHWAVEWDVESQSNQP